MTDYVNHRSQSKLEWPLRVDLSHSPRAFRMRNART